MVLLFLFSLSSRGKIILPKIDVSLIQACNSFKRAIVRGSLHCDESTTLEKQRKRGERRSPRSAQATPENQRLTKVLRSDVLQACVAIFAMNR